MKTVLFLPLILLIQLSLNAQESNPDDIKELFNDAEFFFAQEEYVDALYDYVQIYNGGYKDVANINYKMGICYLNIPDQKQKSISYLLEAVKDVAKKYNETSLKQKSAPYDAWLFLGNAYRVNNQLADAINAYNKYKEVVGVSEEIKYADQQISACNTALRFMGNPLRIKMTNLGDSVNGASSNFKAVVSGNGKTLLYMNELPFYDAVYFSQYTDHGWSSPINITPQIQSDGDQYVTCVSYDGNRLFLTREDAFNSDIYESTFKDGKWSRSFPVQGQDINTKFWESHASLSKDGKTLYFTSNRKDGIGDMDLYVSKVLSDGTWGQPANMGSVINTTLNEDTPFITENDSILYFSSQGHDNMGGYDIFVSRLDASGQWTKPENIQYPLNTTDDDLFYYPWDNARVGFISRIADKGFGKEDIYAIQPYDDVEYYTIQNEIINQQLPATPALVEIVPDTPVSKPSEPSEPSEPTELPVPVAEPSEQAKPVPPSTPKDIALEPVYFAFDNFQLNEIGKAQLGKIAQLLKDFPVARVRLIGHADAKGPAEYNLKLSEKRAVTAKNYLLEQGIEPSRMETTGMGEKNFAAINTNPDGSDNPEGRRLNRRVEYEIIGTDDTVILIRMSQIPESLKFRE